MRIKKLTKVSLWDCWAEIDDHMGELGDFCANP